MNSELDSPDQDVAAILGLPSDRFAASRPGREPRRPPSRAWLFGLLLLAALSSGAIIAVLTHRPDHTFIAMEARLQGQDMAASVKVAPPTSKGGSAGSTARERPRPAASVEPSSIASVTSVDETATASPPPPPPPPDRSVYEELKPSPPPSSQTGIVTAPVDRLTQPKTERLAAMQNGGGSLELTPRVRVPEWLSTPNGEDVARAYPPDALRDGVPGSVELACLELPDGSVVDCRVLGETPVGSGFGRAALRLSHLFRFSPATVNGRSVEAPVQIPYDFSVVD